MAKTPPKSGAFAALALLLGPSLANTLMADTRADEHREYKAYHDLGGVWTICDGTTRGVKPGDIADDPKCDALTAADLLVSAKAVLTCAPALKGHFNQLRAAVRFNNNTGKFCSSSAAPLFRAGKLRAGCDRLLAYNGVVSTGKPIKGALTVKRMKPDAKGRPRFFNIFRGLQNRRANEHKVCVKDLP